MWEEPGQPCRIHAYTVYTPIGGKGRCRTSCNLQDHSTQARKSAGKISTLDLKPMGKDTRSPKQEQSVAPQNGPWSKEKEKKSYQKKPQNVAIFMCSKDECDLQVAVAFHRCPWVGKAILVCPRFHLHISRPLLFSNFADVVGLDKWWTRWAKNHR